ncbi:MAG: hypothetical protein J5486_02665 [Bacteroidaceae bacterium]|nr:hypothetical protein [Bacteroidaceae bacterium]
MNKIYQKPSVDTSLAQTTQMLANSFTKYDTGADEDVVLTKESSDWDNIWSE